MILDILGFPLHEGMLLALGFSPGSGLWASLGRREAGLCRIFAAAYTTRIIQHFSASNWTSMAGSGGDPGAYLINLDLDIAGQVISYASRKEAFCMAGFYAVGGRGLETLLVNLPTDVFYFDLLSVDQLSEPLRLLSGSKPVRLVISAVNEILGQAGNLLGVHQ
jgi:hypothetical protein